MMASLTKNARPMIEQEEGMSDTLPVGGTALREEVRAKYREVAVNPHGRSSMAFRNGRWPACGSKLSQ
jgi:hypothetical protein